ncbi:hypothetical protein [Paracoccus methylarcula]|uniref:Uncharacterized protein n=1 Tax=Paracoccus methylarcula TaxID=72022 RepID=A0A3R7N9Q9_9RHOB|nr:hypothetical protein [Paracoccus methylarcula]RNF32801.1 hypothetical protein A7A09_020280 [Paracoccus methylarcula]
MANDNMKANPETRKRLEIRNPNGQTAGTSAEAGLVTLAAGAVGLGMTLLQQSEAEAATVVSGALPEQDVDGNGTEGRDVAGDAPPPPLPGRARICPPRPRLLTPMSGP